MKHSLVILSVVVVLALTAGFGFAGSNIQMHVNVPFSFYAGEKQLAAGEYLVEMESGNLPSEKIVTLRAQNGTGVCVLAAQPETNTDPSLNQLQFKKSGEKRVLSGVSIQGVKAAVQKLQPKNDVWDEFNGRQRSISVMQN